MDSRAYSPLAKMVNRRRTEKHHSMPERDGHHRIPNEWLRANATCFHLSNLDIVVHSSSNAGDLQNCPGIYFLLDRGEIIYVGLANAIHDRLQQHLRRGIWWDAHTWFEAPIMHLADIESYYIRRIMPRLNVKIPPKGRYADYVRALSLDI